MKCPGPSENNVLSPVMSPSPTLDEKMSVKYVCPATCVTLFVNYQPNCLGWRKLDISYFKDREILLFETAEVQVVQALSAGNVYKL